MHSLDIAAIAIYLLGIIGVGAWFGRRQTRTEFFTASRSMGWLTVGLSVMATLFSSNSFVFYPSAAFGDSLRIGMTLIGLTLMTPVVMWVFIPVYAHLNVETAYEYLERRFHVAIRLLASGLFVLLRIGWMASATYAASVLVASATGISQTSVILGIGAVSVVYTMVGGLRAVMWTDVVQFLIFATTIIATLFLILSHGDLTFSDISATYFEGRENLVVDFTPSMTLQYGSWAILIGLFLEGLSAFGADQVAVQRYLAAKSQRTSQLGALLNITAIWIVLPGLLLIGMGLYGYYMQHPGELGARTLAEVLEADPDVADRAMSEFVRTHFPPGLAGLFLAALLAAIMSSIDSGIHSVTTALIVDFRDRLFPGLKPTDERHEVRTIRVLVLVIGALAITLACFVGPLGNVFDIAKKLTAAFGAPLLAIFILAFFSRRVEWVGVLISGVVCTAATLWLMYTQDWFSMWYWPIGFTSTLVLGYVLSLLRPPQPTEFTYFDLIRNQRGQTDAVS